MKMNLPNKLAILRIILVIPFVIFLSLALEVSDNAAVSVTMRIFAAIIFVGASITDYYDGKIALLLIPLILTIVSGVEYVLKCKNVLNK